MKFSEGTIRGMLRVLYKLAKQILANQEIIMAREDEIKQDVADAAAAAQKGFTEVGELITAGNAAITALREQVSAEQAKNAALQTALDTALASGVSDAVAADIRAQVDATVAAATDAATQADAAEADWNALVPPPAPPAA